MRFAVVLNNASAMLLFLSVKLNLGKNSIGGPLPSELGLLAKLGEFYFFWIVMSDQLHLLTHNLRLVFLSSSRSNS